MFEDESTGGEGTGFVETTGVQVLLSTAPDEATAVLLARALVGSKVAACVNIVPKVRSIYRWQGAIEDSVEVLLLIKTTRAEAGHVAEILKREHPYECPELLALDVTGGLEAYLGWVTAESSTVSPIGEFSR